MYNMYLQYNVLLLCSVCSYFSTILLCIELCSAVVDQSIETKRRSYRLVEQVLRSPPHKMDLGVIVEQSRVSLPT